MEPDKTDQQKFDDDVNRVGKTVLQVAAGVGIVAALIMSVLALTLRTSGTTTVVARTPASASPALPAAPQTASIAITHVLRGCHDLSVNGAAATSPNATIHLVAGGTLRMQNNDVMPHQLVLLHGGQAEISGVRMNHMGATSSVTFPTSGTYTFTTKPGEDYTSGITTVGPDNTLKLNVIVGSTASAA
jgi:plastocyanin